MATVRRYNAKLCSLWYNSIKVGEAYDCVVSITMTMIEHAAFGDGWQQREPDIADWKITGKRYTLASGVGLGTVLDIIGTLAATADPIPLVAKAYAKEADESSKLIEGPVWVSSATANLPRGSLVNEEIELVGAGDPTYVIGV